MGWFSGILAIFRVIGALIDGVKLLHSEFKSWMASRKKEKIDKAQDKLEKANQIPNDDLRLKEKMDAMCELEKIDNPNSDCDK